MDIVTQQHQPTHQHTLLPQRKPHNQCRIGACSLIQRSLPAPATVAAVTAAPATAVAAAPVVACTHKHTAPQPNMQAAQGRQTQPAACGGMRSMTSGSAHNQVSPGPKNSPQPLLPHPPP